MGGGYHVNARKMRAKIKKPHGVFIEHEICGARWSIGYLGFKIDVLE